MKFILSLTAVVVFFFTTPSLVFASAPQSIFSAEYTISPNGDADVTIVTKIQKPGPNIFVKEFQMTFSGLFDLQEISAFDDAGGVPVEIEKKDRLLDFRLNFTDAADSGNAYKQFTLKFVHKNLFKPEGKVWEIIIPTIQTENSEYSVSLVMPDNSKKISIAKPRPGDINGNRFNWHKITTKSLFAAFGSQQDYQVKLKYNLLNSSPSKKNYAVAFPPETAYQKVLINSILPEPANVYIDGDGNYIGVYKLDPQEKRQIIFDGFITTLTVPQDDFEAYSRKVLNKQKQYLLSGNRYWEITDNELSRIQPSVFSDPRSIYNYVVGTLEYNYDRVEKNLPRLGATEVLKTPNQAVCTEFTDLFIALAREKGIYAREINGFAYSQDATRPLSLATDILHAWPEFFDQDRQSWVPVDPTWGKTSGLDYFTSLDHSHLVFAIHGRDPVNPLAAGMYKIEDSKDVNVNVTSVISPEVKRITVTDSLPQKIRAESNLSYNFDLKIKNTGNVFIKNSAIELSSQSFIFKPESIPIDLLAPYQPKIVNISYMVRPADFEKKDTVIEYSLNGATIRRKSIIIQYLTNHNELYKMILKIGLLVFGVLLLIILIKRVSIRHAN